MVHLHDKDTRNIVGMNPSSPLQGLRSVLPDGFFGGSMDVATQALGLKRALTHRSHSIHIEAALRQVEADSVRKAIESFKA